MTDEQMKQESRPNITDPDFRWTGPANTDVQATWRRFGWTPPSERKDDKDRKAA